MAKMKVCNYAKECSEEFGSEIKSKDIMDKTFLNVLKILICISKKLNKS